MSRFVSKATSPDRQSSVAVKLAQHDNHVANSSYTRTDEWTDNDPATLDHHQKAVESGLESIGFARGADGSFSHTAHNDEELHGLNAKLAAVTGTIVNHAHGHYKAKDKAHGRA
jgi:hypothetical protein